MPTDCYYGTYARFESVSKTEAATLLGSDCIVGEVFSIDFKPVEGATRAWVVNPFGKVIGYLDEKTSHHLNVLSVKGWNLNAVLSFVAFTDEPEPGHYWGEVALFCFDKAHETDFTTFMNGASKSISQGIRPRIDLENLGVESVLKSHGSWQPSQRVDIPKGDKHTAILKKSRSMTDYFVQKGREGNKGCYFVSWAFLLALVALMLFGLKSCGVF